ncbi:hypothetical protein [Cytobacillus kochii]|uniref:hypothetical protein n=1 Tax=Cytobacillus kochii TaxID=859143 RepID=UPI00402A6532
MNKRVDIEFLSDRWTPGGFEYREKGILFENGKVLAVDDIGGINIYELVELKGDSLAVVAEGSEIDYDRDLLINLILGGK